mmetsp:Transcript_12858/g.19923  ORF Transcript_12858/g.19923 Transcript_12858/m.19923 type:complete len:99 (-) Transcript_12858:3164-3460(-)
MRNYQFDNFKNPGHGFHQMLNRSQEFDTEPIQIHLVPFTRTDVGFKKTVDEYYSGTNQMTQHASVRTILTSVVEQLMKDPQRKFTFSEVKYLQMWYSR